MARRQIDNYERNRETTSPEQKDQTRNMVTGNLRSDIQMKTRDAEMASKTQEVTGGQMTPAIENITRDIEESIRLVIRAANADLINKPPHEPSRIFFDKLIQTLSGGFEHPDAPYLQPLITGLLGSPDYIRFSQEGEENTPFENDLRRIVSTAPGGSRVEGIVTDIINQMRNEGQPINISQEQFEEKKNAARAARQQEVHAQREEIQEIIGQLNDDSEMTRQEDRYLLNLIEQGDDEDSRLATEMLKSMQSPERFLEFYRGRFEHILENNPKVQAIQHLDKRRERASKETTDEINRTLLYMVHKIFAPVIEGGSDKPFNQLVQDATTGYMLNPQTVFYNLKKKIMYLSHPISERDTQWDQSDMKFYQYKNTKKRVWVPNSEEDDKRGKTTVLGKFVEETVSMELKESSYKEFLQNMYLAIDAEKDLLETGINFNFLMSTGKTSEQQTFFQQAAQYAKQTLPANRLDELYKLPYADLVEAAKIQLSSYYKKKMAMNHWRKNPEILLGLFENMNEVEHEALKDMIHNFGDTPEWVIRRAFIHARMHLSLVNLEMHAISSYAHATLDDLTNPTYRDQALKNLDVYRTWYGGEMWQVADTLGQGIAFLPQPNLDHKIEDWYHEDISGEGEEIYRQSFLLGHMATVDRKNYDIGMMPNIEELNPMGNGGVEIQLGWRMKYAMYPWIQDMLDVLNNENKFDLRKDSDQRTFEYGWKRLENISANVLKIYRDEFLFDESYLKQIDDEGTVQEEKQYEHFFKFLYRRYFSDGVGKRGYYGDIASESDFWEQKIKPILRRKPRKGEGESAKDAVSRSIREKKDELKNIVSQALTVVAFERVPMDFVFMESSTRSQNGVTLLQELQQYFHNQEDPKYKLDVEELDNVFDDILFVQQKARTDSIEKMNNFVREQTDREEPVKILYGKNMDSLKQDRSDVELVEGQQKKGYVISQEVIAKLLKKKYDNIPSMTEEEKQLRIQRAVKVFEQIEERIVEKPIDNPHAENPEISDLRVRMAMKKRGLNSEDEQAFKKFKEEYKKIYKAELEKYKDEVMTRRIEWSQKEIIGGQTALPINDTAYQFLELVKGGRDMVQRSLSAVAVMQERYRNDVAGGEYVSALKKYYRKEDLETLHKLITEMRNSIKEEDGDAANRMAMRVLENAVNAMRINEDAENTLVEAQYIAKHRRRSAFSQVVKEGPEFPLHREDRYRIVKDFLHYSQFPKRAAASAQVYEHMPSYSEQWKDKAWLGEQMGRVVDAFLGTKDGKVVRKRWKEMSGEALRDREIANIMDLVTREGPKYVLLIMLAVIILAAKKGFEDNES